MGLLWEVAWYSDTRVFGRWYHFKRLAMKGIRCWVGWSRPGYMDYLTFGRVIFHIPFMFSDLENIKVSLELLRISRFCYYQVGGRVKCCLHHCIFKVFHAVGRGLTKVFITCVQSFCLTCDQIWFYLTCDRVIGEPSHLSLYLVSQVIYKYQEEDWSYGWPMWDNWCYGNLLGTPPPPHRRRQLSMTCHSRKP